VALGLRSGDEGGKRGKDGEDNGESEGSLSDRFKSTLKARDPEEKSPG